MTEDYRIYDIQTMPFESHKHIFAFWFYSNFTEEYPYKIFMDIVYGWCLENFGRGGWYISGNKVSLSDDCQATAFKLRW